jgi:hypothetical protein
VRGSLDGAGRPCSKSTVFRARPNFLFVCCVVVASFSAGTASWSQTIDLTNLGTTNRDQVFHFTGAVARSNGPVTILAFGDSVSQTYRSIQLSLFGRLMNSVGSAGYSLLAPWNTALFIPGGGASITSATANWWTPHAILPPNGFVFWTNQSGTFGSLTCDQVGVFWVAQPNGGQFTLSVSTNGDAWSSPLLTLEGFSPEPTGRFASVQLARQPYRIRVDGLGGTNVILGPRYRDSTSTGVEIAFMCQDGANLNQIFSLPPNVLGPVMAALNPQLVVWHMKELADIGESGLSNRLSDLEGLWNSAVTNGDVVYIGTPYDLTDLTTVWTPIQNSLVRQAAVRNHRAYLDCMTPCVSYQSMTNNGFLDDTIHPSTLCDNFLANLVWQQLGLFALRVDRTLAIDAVESGTRVAWTGASGITFELQSSSDLVRWAKVFSGTGNGKPQAYTNLLSPATTTFYRLNLISP